MKVGLLKDQPDQWKGLRRLVSSLSPLLKSEGDFHKGYSWEVFSQKCLTDILRKDVSQIDFKGRGLGLRAYAQVGDFSSPNPLKRAELMTQTDLVWPLVFYRGFHQDSQVEELFEKLFKLLPSFFDNEHSFLANWYPLEKDLMPQDQETWYFLENGLIKFGWIAFLANDDRLKEIYLKFCQTMIEMAQENCYLFPLRFDWRKGQVVGEKKNFIAAGLYSYGMCLAYEMTHDDKFLGEVKKSLKAIRQLPLNLLFHEPQQLGFAAAAGYILAEKLKDPIFREWSDDFLAQQLRMFYWYTDLGVKNELGCDCAGMVRSFPSKIYPVIKHNPAFKENVESVLPWTVLLKTSSLTPALLKFLNLVRVNNFYYFDLFQQNKDLCFIPLESLPALSESGSRHRGGGVGHAIYGAGEVLWLYLLFEALASSSNPEIMVLSLDYLNPGLISGFGKKQNFVVFNPTGEKQTFLLKIRKPPKSEFNLRFGTDKKLRVTEQEARLGIKMTLGARKHEWIGV